MKKTVKLENVDPVKLFGAGNKILEEFCTYYPTLKVIARGDEIILDGKDTQVEDFEAKINELIRSIDKSLLLLSKTK